MWPFNKKEPEKGRLPTNPELIEAFNDRGLGYLDHARFPQIVELYRSGGTSKVQKYFATETPRGIQKPLDHNTLIKVCGIYTMARDNSYLNPIWSALDRQTTQRLSNLSWPDVKRLTKTVYREGEFVFDEYAYTNVLLRADQVQVQVDMMFQRLGNMSTYSRRSPQNNFHF